MFSTMNESFSSVPASSKKLREYFSKYITINNFLDALDIILGVTLHQKMLEVIEKDLLDDEHGHINEWQEAALSFGIITGVKSIIVITKTLTLLLWLRRQKIKRTMCNCCGDCICCCGVKLNLSLDKEFNSEYERLNTEVDYDDFLEHGPLVSNSVPFRRISCAYCTEILGTAGLAVTINALTQVNIDNSFALADFIAIMMKRIIIKIGDHLFVICFCGCCFVTNRGYQQLLPGSNEEKSLITRSQPSYGSVNDPAVIIINDDTLVLDMSDN